MMNLYEELRRLLAPGFYPDNFLQAARLAEEASWQADAPLALYVLSRILLALGEDWPRQGVETSVADDMRRTMEPPISSYLADAATRDLTPEQEAFHLNSIVRAFLSLRSAHD